MAKHAYRLNTTSLKPGQYQCIRQYISLYFLSIPNHDTSNHFSSGLHCCTTSFSTSCQFSMHLSASLNKSMITSWHVSSHINTLSSTSCHKKQYILLHPSIHPANSQYISVHPSIHSQIHHASWHDSKTHQCIINTSCHISCYIFQIYPAQFQYIMMMLQYILCIRPCI